MAENDPAIICRIPVTRAAFLYLYEEKYNYIII